MLDSADSLRCQTRVSNRAPRRPRASVLAAVPPVAGQGCRRCVGAGCRQIDAAVWKSLESPHPLAASWMWWWRWETPGTMRLGCWSIHKRTTCCGSAPRRAVATVRPRRLVLASCESGSPQSAAQRYSRIYIRNTGVSQHAPALSSGRARLDVCAALLSRRMGPAALHASDGASRP